MDLLVGLDTEVEDWDLASPACDNPFRVAEVEVGATDCDRSNHAEGGGQSPGHHASLESHGPALGCRVGAEEEVGKAAMKWSRGQYQQGRWWRAFCCY